MTEGRDFVMAMGIFPIKEGFLTLLGISIEDEIFPPMQNFTRAHVHVIYNYFINNLCSLIKKKFKVGRMGI